jgi:hypothetical protein
VLPHALCIFTHVYTTMCACEREKLSRDLSHDIYMHIYTHIHTHIHTYVYVYVYTYIHVCMHVCICMHAGMYTCIHALCILASREHVWVYVHKHTFICANTNINTIHTTHLSAQIVISSSTRQILDKIPSLRLWHCIEHVTHSSERGIHSFQQRPQTPIP